MTGVNSRTSHDAPVALLASGRAMADTSQMPFRDAFILAAVLAASSSVLRASPVASPVPAFERTGRIASPDLAEASGLEASRTRPGHFYAINDGDRAPELFVLTPGGADVARIAVRGARNVDWEALASAPSPGRGDARQLVIGDIGDNAARRDHVTLYFVDEPRPDEAGGYPPSLPVAHTLTLRYPDGPRDAEAMAWDPVSDRLVIVTKRDRPARVYAVERERALATDEARLDFVGTLHPLRPPDDEDARRFGRQAPWVSQPTGLDIAADGSEFAVITYRSLYRFARPEAQNLATAMAAAPVEQVGPPGAAEEAVAFEAGARTVLIAAEGRGAALYRQPPAHAAVPVETFPDR